MVRSVFFVYHSLTHTHTSRSGTNLEEWVDGVREIVNVTQLVIMSGRINDGDEDIPVRQRDRERVFAWLKRVQDDVACEIVFIRKEFVLNSKRYTHDGDTYYGKLKLGDDIISEGDFVKVKLKDAETVDGEDVDVRSVGVREYYSDFNYVPRPNALHCQCAQTPTPTGTHRSSRVHVGRYLQRNVDRHRWFYYPESTRLGRLPCHHRYEVIETIMWRNCGCDSSQSECGSDYPVELDSQNYLCHLFYSPHVGLMKKISGKDRTERGLSYKTKINGSWCLSHTSP